MKIKEHKILRILFVLLFVGYYGSMTLFPHIHMDGNQRIVHSHPYTAGNSAQPGHTHSSTGFQFIQLLNQLVMMGVTFATLFAVRRQLLQVSRNGIERRIIHLALPYYSLRAPPCLN